jgi:hypothetical protein
MIVPVQAFGCFQRLVAFAAPAPTNHKYGFFQLE